MRPGRALPPVAREHGRLDPVRADPEPAADSHYNPRMSIIVATTRNGRTVMAADSLTCFGDSHRVPPENAMTPKVRRLGSSIIGSAGWGVYDRILDAHLADRPAPDFSGERAIFAFFVELWKVMHDQYNFVNDQAQSKDSPFGDLDSSFLIANRDGLFKVSPDMDVSRFDRYYAIGSGAEYALGALYVEYPSAESAEDLARLAVGASIALDVYCGGEITVLAVE